MFLADMCVCVCQFLASYVGYDLSLHPVVCMLPGDPMDTWDHILLARQWLLYVHHIYVCVSICRYIICTRTFFTKIIFIATILMTEQTKLL